VPWELFLGQIFDFWFLENWFSPETCTIDASFWGNPRSSSPWKRAILEIGLTLFLGSDSCSPYSHTNTDANHHYLVGNSVACANSNCVLAIVLFLNESSLSGWQFCCMRKFKLCSCNSAFPECGECASKITQNE
jgi:hypothetical protein